MPLNPKMYSVENGDRQILRVDHECLLFVESMNEAVVFIVDQNMPARTALEYIIAKLPRALVNLNFKLIGPKDPLKNLEETIRVRGFKVSKAMALDGAPIELIFLPREKRILIEKQKPLKLLVVDDSKTVCDVLSKIFASDPGIVIETCQDPREVETRLQIFKPDVMTLDIHMPEMTGVELLRFLGPKLRVPTIIISSISIDESPLVLTALELGAVDYIQKPSFDQIKSLTPVFIEKVRTAAKAKVFSKTAFMAKNPTMASGFELDPNLVLVIGSSTGGTEALKSILTQFPANIPPVLIVQHIPATFSKAFADRMNNACKCRVKEAEDGEEASPGKVLIAPGGKQMSFKKKSGKLIVQIDDSPPVNRHKPSVDVLFRAAANELGKNVVGVILTGMGSDGAAGLLEMKQRGAKTIAQNEESCVVFGMPKAAIQAGAVETIVHLKDIPEEIFKLLSKKKRAA